MTRIEKISKDTGDDPAMTQLIAWMDSLDLPIFALRLQPNNRLEFAHANAALARVANVATSAFSGAIASEIFPTRIAECLGAKHRQFLLHGTPHTYEECWRIDGQDRWWQTTLSQPAGFDGTVILGVALETTDSKARDVAAAQTLAKMNDRMEDVRLFSAMAAHDARGPLATLSSLLDMVLEDFEDRGDGKLDLLHLAALTVEEALTQITTTLERARTLEPYDTPRKTIDFGRFCGDIAAMVDPDMALAINVPQAHVTCDEVMVQMGIRNLMSNAARFCAHQITVRIREDAAHGMLMIDVADDGPGLAEGITLQDLTQTGEARAGTHGFGLRAIAKLLMSRGGSLEIVRPAPEDDMQGACFRMGLPGQIIRQTPGNAPTRPSTPEHPKTVAAQ